MKAARNVKRKDAAGKLLGLMGAAVAAQRAKVDRAAQGLARDVVQLDRAIAGMQDGPAKADAIKARDKALRDAPAAARRHYRELLQAEGKKGGAA